MKNIRGIVLRAYDLRDSSRMLEVLTHEGRVSVLCKGARRAKSRSLNLTEPYIEADFNLQAGRDLFYLKDGVLVAARLELREKIERLALAAASCDLLRAVLVEQPEPHLYAFLQAMLDACVSAQPEQTSALFCAYTLKLASLLGYRPALTRCVICGTPVRAGIFDAAAGGMLCEDHAGVQKADTWRMTSEALAFLWKVMCTPFAEIEAENLLRERRMAQMTTRYFLYHTGISEPKSMELLKKLRYL